MYSVFEHVAPEKRQEAFDLIRASRPEGPDYNLWILLDGWRSCCPMGAVNYVLTNGEVHRLLPWTNTDVAWTTTPEEVQEFRWAVDDAKIVGFAALAEAMGVPYV